MKSNLKDFNLNAKEVGGTAQPQEYSTLVTTADISEDVSTLVLTTSPSYTTTSVASNATEQVNCNNM